MLSMQSLVAKRDDQGVFQPLDLTLEAGQAVEVVGANGAGKTTMLRVLAGLHSQYSGAFEIGAFLYQGHRLALDARQNGVSNLRWHSALHGLASDDAAIRDVLARVGILSVGFRLTGQLSQGQQRRLAMARWLLVEKPIWLLDEPLTALDQSGQALLAQLINEKVSQGGVVVYSTHLPMPIDAKQTLNIEAV